MLALYGHPFSSYTWKALIPFYAHGLPFEFRILDADHPDNRAVVQRAGPGGKFPVLDDGGTLVFEASAIIEHLAVHHLPQAGLIPIDPGEAVQVRMLDRTFDNYVMTPMQGIVAEHLFKDSPDPAVCADQRRQLERSYDWLEQWLAPRDTRSTRITLIECAAAPAMFYADWVHQITERWPRLSDWRAHLNALPAVARCIDEARPWRGNFPPGAPDRD